MLEKKIIILKNMRKILIELHISLCQKETPLDVYSYQN